MLKDLQISPSITIKQFRNCILLFVVLVFLIFGKSIGNKYSMDDDFVMYRNQQIQQGVKAIPEIFTTTYVVGQKSSYEYRPLVKVVYAIEYELFGENPKANHIISILFYAFLISYLFYTLLRLLPNYHYLFSLIVCLIFLIHPLHSEVVMSLKNLDVILSLLFSLLSLNMFVKFIEKKKWFYIVFGLIAILFAFMSKRDSIPFLILIPLTLWFFKNATWKQLLIVLSTLFAGVILFVKMASVLVANKPNRTPLFWENPLYFDTKFWDRIPQGMHSIYFYLKMFLLPHPLVSYYGYNQVPLMSWSSVLVWLVVIFLIVVMYYVFKNFKSKSIEVYGILFFLISISMFTNIAIPVVGIVAERFSFIASLGLSIVATWAIFKIFKSDVYNIKMKLSSFKTGIYVTVTIIVLLFGIKTYSRNVAWYNSYTLYETDAKVATESAHTYSLLAAAAVQKIHETPSISPQEKQRLANIALKNYKESLRIFPDYITSHNNVGMVYQTFFNKPNEALPHLLRAVELDTGYVEAYFNLATCQAALQQYDLAEKNYLKVIQLDSNFVKAYQSVSALYSYLKQTDKIIAINKLAIDRKIKSDVPYISLGNVYYLAGDTVAAVSYLEQAIAVVPNNKKVNSFLSNYFQSKGNKEKANYYAVLSARSSN